MFMWGPAGKPSQMTEEGRRVFVNTIVYMKQFDGAKQTVWRSSPVRTDLVQRLKSDYVKTEDQFRDFLPADVVKRLGTDKEKYRALYEPNLGYVRIQHGPDVFAVDEDAQSMGIPNNDVRFLEKCVGQLRNPADAPKARRLLERYTGFSFADADAWQSWFDKNRANLYFSDSYDYHFFAGAAGPRPPATIVPGILEGMKISEPNDVDPVSVGAGAAGYFTYGLKGTAYASVGGVSTLVVRLKIADGWHTYARVPEGIPYELTKINIELPDGFRWHGDWKMPEAHNSDTPGAAEYRGDVIFVRQFYATKPGKAKLSGTVHYQTCDVEKCLPVADKPFEVSVQVR
jgi:hypothetical protein